MTSFFLWFSGWRGAEIMPKVTPRPKPFRLLTDKLWPCRTSCSAKEWDCYSAVTARKGAGGDTIVAVAEGFPSMVPANADNVAAELYCRLGAVRQHRPF